MVGIVFGQTVGYGFINFDDLQYVYENPMVLNGLGLSGIGRAFTHVVSQHWHPLTMIVLMTDYQLFGLWAGGYHLVNILLHAAAVIFLFLLLREMTGATWRSAFVAAVFAIHPLRVESVAWVSECKDVLSGMFFMLTLWAYVRYVKKKGRYWTILIWFVLGLLSKPMLVTLPCVLLLLDYWPLGRLQTPSQFGKLLVEKIPLFILSILSSMAAVISLRSGSEPVATYPASAPLGYVAYLGKLFFPIHLALLYPLPKGGPPAWEVLNAMLLLAALSAAVWIYRREHRYLLTGWLWFLGMVLPVAGVMQTGEQVYADRYTYLPQIGLCIAITWLAVDWAGRREFRRAVLKVAAVAIVCALMIAASIQTTYWHDSERLWRRTLAYTTNNSIAHDNLGNTLFQQGKTDQSIGEYHQALLIDHKDPEAYYNLGVAIFKLGRVQEAIDQYQLALQIDPNYVKTHYNLGIALAQQGRLDEAVEQYREAIRLNPDYPEAHNNLGTVLLDQNHTEEAITEFQKALDIRPIYAEASNNLGNAFLQAGRPADAIPEYRAALKADPNDAQAHNNLGSALYRLGQVDDAIAEFQEAVKINPAYADARRNLGAILFERGLDEQAAGQYRAALRINGSDAIALFRLAWILATTQHDGLRNGVEALGLASNANRLTGGGNPVVLRALAAAYAATGDFPHAAQSAQAALQLAQAASDADLAANLRREIALYHASHPFEKTP